MCCFVRFDCIYVCFVFIIAKTYAGFDRNSIVTSATSFPNMDLLTFLRVIVLVTNGVYCFVPRGDLEPSAARTISLPIQQQNAPANDISVYDPGVGE